MSPEVSDLYIKLSAEEISESFRSIGGYRSIKETLKQYCDLISQTQTLNDWGVDVHGKILLHGPPGTGKTTLVKALAKEMKIPLIMIRTVQIRSKYIAEAGQNLEKLIMELKESHKASIVFFDEFDSIAMDRGKFDMNSEDQKVVNALLTAFDSISLVEHQILLIAATNLEQILDDAVWRRFDEIIFVGLPDLEQRRAILQILTRKVPKRCLDIGSLGQLAEITADWSGADLKRLINHAIINYLSQAEPRTTLDLTFFQRAIESGIISPTTLKHHKSFSTMRKDRLEEEKLKEDAENQALFEKRGRRPQDLKKRDFGG